MSSELTPPQGTALDFDALALMHLDGALDPVQHEDFSRQVASDPFKAMRLAEIAELHAAMGELGRTSMAPTIRPASSVSTRSHRRAARGRRKHIMPAWGMAAAALLAVGIAIGALALAWSPATPDVLHVTQGSVIRENKAGRMRVSHGAVPLQPGDRLLVNGSTTARITTTHGDRLDLNNGTHLSWASNGATVNLLAGSFTAEVTPRTSDAPFRVRTPKADLTVLGTRFTVQADEGLSLLAVDHGRVRLTNRDDARHVEVAAQQVTVTTGAGDLTAAVGNIPSMAVTGLTGDYFDNTDFTNWRMRRVDETIDFDWADRGPDQRVGFESFSVRWRGWLVPAHSGTCTLTFLMDDGVRLWLDGRLVLDEWHLTEKLEFSATVTLEAGRAYAVRLDYFQEPRDAVIRWYWSNSDHAKQPVPTSWLRPVEWTPPATSAP